MQCTSTAIFSPSLQRTSSSSPPIFRKKLAQCPTTVAKPPILALNIGVQEVAELAHNKVLVASTLSCLVGQISKPFTSAINGKGIDLKAAVRSGGMPSTHSAAVAAAATSIGLESRSVCKSGFNKSYREAKLMNLGCRCFGTLLPSRACGKSGFDKYFMRGFYDSIFGLSVVFASVVMYDAQGVRREVGNQAKILNKLQINSDLDSNPAGPSINSKEISPLFSVSENPDPLFGKLDPYPPNRTGVTATKLSTLPDLEVDIKEPSQKSYSSFKLLNESVGHNEIQVLVGALLGFIVSLVVEAIL